MTWVPLKRVADVWPSNVDKLTVEGERPVRLVNYTDVYYGDRLHPGLDLMAATATSDEIAKFRLQRGDVILTKDSETADDIGISAHVDDASPDMVCGYHLSLVRPRAAVGRYLHYAVSSTHARRQMSVSATGVTRFGLRAESVGSLSVWVPPEAEQRAIADYLDAETARIDVLIAKKQRLIQLLEERLETEMTELACGRLEGEPLRESGIDWIGRIPVGWQVSRLNKLARLESGHTPSRSREILWVNTDKPWITLNDVGTLSGSEFIGETKNLISDAGLAASSARMLPAHTVVLSRDATIGRVGIMATSMATSQHFAAWVCSSALRPRFLWLLLRYPMQPFLASFDDGATLRTIGMPHVRRFVIPVPPVEEQDRLVSLAEQRRAAMTTAGHRLARQLDLLAEHRQALITAAVTGEFAVPRAA